MGIRTNWMADRERVPLPSVATTDPRAWEFEYAQNIGHGPRNGRIQRYILLDEMVIETREIVVHTFIMGDVEDPDLYAAEPLYEWQQSDQGQWVMSNALETPIWHRSVDPTSFGHRYTVTATFGTKALTEFYLRFGKPKLP
jgi:hypothetical protein